MAFSGALTLTDLNDFITPSQACIKPVEQVKAPQDFNDQGAASTQIHVDSSGAYYEVLSDEIGPPKATRKLETAQISLNDCLACSGCITSAESVLITLQSHVEVLNVLANNPPPSAQLHRRAVLSISPQSLASLAASVSSSSSTTVTLRQILSRVRAFCLELGFDRVYDTTFARHIALLEHAQEFRERKWEASQGGEGQKENGKLPMLASACPGWVCYAEKTHPEMLPFISQAKSPQQVMGTLVKNWLGEKWGKKPDEIYHVTVMPCYDKKLEASRQDFYNDIYSTRDVDCVITTGELELMMRERGFDLSRALPDEVSFPPSVASLAQKIASIDSIGALSKSDLRQLTGGRELGSEAHPQPQDEEPRLPELLTHPGSSSGSYLQSLIADYTTKDAELVTRTVRTADYEEYVLTDTRTGRVVFKGAKCYGFRNLQNLVRKVGREAGVQVGRGAAGKLAAVRAKRRAVAAKTGASAKGGAPPGDEEEAKTYDYVEVMACPSGCVNGGGQLRPNLQRESALAQSDSTVQIPAAQDISPPSGFDAEPGVQNAAKWGNKEWIKKVEQAYWHELPTPPPSPPLRASDSDRSDAPASIEAPQASADQRPSVKRSQSSLAAADKLAARVLVDLCKPRGDFGGSWSSPMDSTAEGMRRQFFRTQYRAIESEVIGIAVKW